MENSAVGVRVGGVRVGDALALVAVAAMRGLRLVFALRAIGALHRNRWNAKAKSVGEKELKELSKHRWC
jgi:hypothetical protein